VATVWHSSIVGYLVDAGVGGVIATAAYAATLAVSLKASLDEAFACGVFAWLAHAVQSITIKQLGQASFFEKASCGKARSDGSIQSALGT
jgi:hypothetical protein